jgi:archaellum biogenesis ATPase FlaH
MITQIQSIKDKYGQQSEQIISSGLNLVKKGSKYRCPNSIAHKNNDRNPSMSWDSNALQFHCFTCGMNIDLYGYYKDHLNYTHNEIIRDLLGEVEHTKTSVYKKRNEFAEELKKITPITQECIDYLGKRKITQETIEYFQLKSYNGMIAFPYYRYETVVGYKTRKPLKDPGKPKMLSLKGSKPYLFNSQNIEDTEHLFLSEGEGDCMCIWQCGYKNVVSVGAGANSMATLIEQADSFLRKFDNLIIVSDNDEAGANMDKFFLDKYGDKVKLIDKSLYTKNDINEELFYTGEAGVRKILESGLFRIEGRRDLDIVPYKGITKREGKYVPTGLPTIDNAINDLAPGLVTVVVGRQNSGKTTLTKQIIANAIDTDNKVYVVSGEGDPEMFINEIYRCVIGHNREFYETVLVNKRYHKEPRPHILKALQKWHKGKLTTFTKTESKINTTDKLFAMIDKEVKIKRHNLIVIDNLMSIVSSSQVEKNAAQAEFVQKCHELAMSYRTHILLVVHPNKEFRKDMEMEVEYISGNSDIGNKADNVIAVKREYDEVEIKNMINGNIAILKNRYYSELARCDVYYNSNTGQLQELTDEGRIEYEFNWQGR